MTSQTGQKLITVHVLSNISRSKGNQTMRNYFFEKSHTNVVKLVPEPFVKNEKLSISQDQMSEML